MSGPGHFDALVCLVWDWQLLALHVFCIGVALVPVLHWICFGFASALHSFLVAHWIRTGATSVRRGVDGVRTRRVKVCPKSARYVLRV